MKKTIKIITQNCFFSLPKKKLGRLLQKEQADIYCLQEVTSIRFVNRLNKIVGYSIAVSNPTKTVKIFNFYNVILSKYPILESGELLFEEKLNRRRRIFKGKAFWTVLEVGNIKIKIYNCHLNLFRQGVEERAEILTKIMTDSKKFKGPVIICGDMNTGVPKDKPYRKIIKVWSKYPMPSKDNIGDYASVNEKFYFLNTAKKYNFSELSDINQNTWRMPVILSRKMQLKLDWMLYNKLKPIGCRFGPWIGDHRSIIGELTF